MSSRLRFILQYTIFWLILFLLGKLAFLLYQHTQSFALPLSDWFRIFIHGFRLDVSATAYFAVIPTVILSLTAWFRGRIPHLLISGYTLIMVVVFLLITLVDLELYKYWGSHLDTAPLRFLSTPSETLASSSFITLALYFAAFGGFTWLLFRLYLRIARRLKDLPRAGAPTAFVFLFLTALLFLPIRGGWNVSVMNPGSAFFSHNAFANQAAVNPVWNFGHSVVEGKETKNPWAYFKDPNYAREFTSLYAYHEPAPRMFNTSRPNVVLIILESFTAKLIEPLGGSPGVTPNFNRMCSEGIFFSNIYSTDSRTDKGLATVLSGYPVLEAIPILKYADKTQHLPFLSKDLGALGYKTAYHYGGDIDFANMRSYVINGDFNRMVSESDFPAAEATGKWGIPDHLSFRRFMNDIRSDSGRWLHVMLTISNHEPFEIPMKPKFGSEDLTSRFHSSAWYADSCLGDFIRQYKESGLWDNSVIIMVADHGTRIPDYSEVFEPRKFHIPLLMVGGAIARDTVVAKFGSQADIAVTLLHQLGVDTQHYFLGKDLLAPDSKSFAFYSFKNGVALMTDTLSFGLDLTAGQLIFSNGSVPESRTLLARAYQQYVFNNYLGLSKTAQRRAPVRK
jgi:phosphoglycerol transferase MdoB-like AlkP superfamily enzyme